MKFTAQLSVKVPYVSELDISYKHASRVSHLRTFGSRYGDETTSVTLEKFVGVVKKPDGSTTETVFAVIDGKAVPFDTFAKLMNILHEMPCPTYEVVSQEKARQIRDDIEAEALAAEAKGAEPS